MQLSFIKLTDCEFQDIVSFVYNKYGIDLKKKRQLIESRFAYILKSKNLSTFREYFDIIYKDDAEMQVFLNRITTNHSYFARETNHFDYLVNHILPELDKKNLQEFRIWSAGCSTGQEAYNIAMAIDQYYGATKGNLDTKILATDISTNVLTKAQQGIYTLDSIKGLPTSWIHKYFTKLPNGEYQVVPKIRNEVIFKKSNLMDPFNFKKPFDIIFCRNVMIYFDFETTQNLVNKFYSVTKKDGYLLVGHSESIDRNIVHYDFLQTAIYKRTK